METKTFRTEKPTRQFLLFSRDEEGNEIDPVRWDVDAIPALIHNIGLDIKWRYENPGEGGVAPSGAEWEAAHESTDYHCATGSRPCQACAAAGYDPITKLSVPGRIYR